MSVMTWLISTGRTYTIIVLIRTTNQDEDIESATSTGFKTGTYIEEGSKFILNSLKLTFGVKYGLIFKRYYRPN